MRTLIAISILTAVTAGAQTQGPNCSASTGAQRTLLAEGSSELTADLLITCTGGTPTGQGAAIPVANIQVFFNATVTSRILSSPWSEVLLLLDEPAPGAQFACDTTNGVCVGVGNGVGSKYYGPGSSGTAGNNKNVFQGEQTASNSLTWLGVPIDPPGSNGTRIIRITNARVNASQLATGGLSAAPAGVVASISITSQSTLPLSGATQTVGFVSPGTAVSLRDASSSVALTSPALISGCANSPMTKVATLRYAERFASAFTRRNVSSSPFGQAPQNNLTVTYRTQSGFYSPNLTGSSARGNLGTAGLADFGTRLRAVFNNIPAGLNLFVDTYDAFGRAQLTSSESGVFSPVISNGPAQLSVSNGTAIAVWEMLGDDPLSIEQLDFGIYTDPSANISGAGATTVSGSLAPVSAAGTNSGATIPRYLDTSTAANLLTVAACGTAASPTITSLNPSSATTGDPGFILTVTGTNFVQGAQVLWNGAPLTTGLASPTQLFATVPVGLVARQGIASVTVANPGDPVSNTVLFPIALPGAPVAVSSAAITFQFGGGVQIQTRQIQVVSKSGAPVSFSATAALTTPAAAWLSVDPKSAVTPATLNVTVNPAGLRPGIYVGTITLSPVGGSFSAKNPVKEAAGDVVVTVTLVISDQSLTFTFLTGGPKPTAKSMTVAALSDTNARFTAATSVATPRGGAWLAVAPSDTNAPASLSVSIDPTGLAPGTYTGGITLSPADSSGTVRQVPVTLFVVAAPSLTLTFSYQAGGAIPPAQSFAATNIGPNGFNADANSDGNWLSVSPASGSSSSPFSCSVNPAGLAAKTYTGFISVTDPVNGNFYVVQVNLTVTGSVSTTQIISHIADGANWKTTIILVNLDSAPASFTVNYWRDDGTPFSVSITGRGILATVTDTIPVGGSRTIETDGTASALTTGWAEVISSQAIGGTAIFRDQNLRQEAAVPLLASAGGRLLLPFDTGGLSLGVALANASQTQDATVTRTLRNAQGQVISSDSVNVIRHGHIAFLLSNPSNKPEDQRGVLEITPASGQIFALGIRGNNGAFTSIDALPPQDVRTKVISHIANGARWKTTIILVNTDTSPASFTVNFWKDDGTPFTLTLVDGRSLASVTGVIPVGGSTTLESDGLAGLLSTGWAEVISAQSMGGTAIFRDQTLRQEAAVPLLSSGGTRLVLPFQGGLDLGVALANANFLQDATLTRTLRNEQGVTIATDSVSAPHRAHSAFLLANPSTRPEDQRGVVEFSSPGVEFFSLGIRGNNGAFTSIRALAK